MAGTRKISFAGNSVEVEDLDIESSKESFNEYELADGTKIRIKSVLVSLMKVVGQFNQDGTEIYLANVSPVVAPIKKAE